MLLASAPCRAVLGSLKFRLITISMAALALGMSLVASLLMRQAETHTIERQREQQAAQAVRIAAVLSRRVVELQRGLHAAASQLRRETLADRASLDRAIEANVVLGKMYSSLYVLDTRGEMILLSRPEDGLTHPGLSLANREYVRRALGQGQAVVSEPFVSRISGEPLVAFIQPLSDAGGIYGALAGSLTLSSRELVADLVQDDGSGALLLVTDTEGRILAHPRERRLLGQLRDEPQLNDAYVAWQQVGSPAEPSGLGLPQPGQVVSLAGVAGTDWLVWLVVPEAELLAPLRLARQHVHGAVAALIAAMSLLMLALLVWLLKPLTQLEHRAQSLFDASRDPQQGWPAAGGEIGRLARVLRHVGAERAQLESFNDEVLKKLMSVMSAAPIGIAFTRLRRFELVSAELCHLLGCREDELIGEPVSMLYADPADYDATVAQIAEAFAQGRPYVGEWRMLRADGSAFWAQIRGRPIDRRRLDVGTIWTLHDVSELVASRQQLEWSASHDGLTGLANRSVYQRHLHEAFELRSAEAPAALVAIDLDHFKPVNDAAGHAAGDAMLKAVAAAIAGQVRIGDLVVRTGGDEFALLLRGCSTAQSLRIAEAIHRAIVSIELPWEGQVLRVGASLGVAALSPETPSVERWLADADAACYAVKRAGRGAVGSATTSLPGSAAAGTAVVP